MNDEQIAEHSNRIFVEHERLKREAANLRDELKQAEAGHATCRAEAARLMDLLIEAQADGNHLRRALEWAAVRDRVGVRTALAATKEAKPDADEC